MNKEIWRPVKDYEGLYEVSNWGRVKSLARFYYCNYNHTQKKEVTETIRKPHIDQSGYCIVHLSKEGAEKRFSVHRLVAMAFLPNPDNLPQVNHKDEDKRNNTVWVNEDGTVNPERSNLEWCDAKYNNNYGSHNKRVSKSRQKSVGQYDISTDQLVATYPSAIVAAQTNKYSQGNITRVCQGYLKSYKGFVWRYI